MKAIIAVPQKEENCYNCGIYNNCNVQVALRYAWMPCGKWKPEKILELDNKEK